MSTVRPSRRLFEVVLALAVGFAFVFAVPSLRGAPAASAQTCADGTVAPAGGFCGSLGTALCGGGSIAYLSSPCPFTAAAGVATNPALPAAAAAPAGQRCPGGVISIGQTCPAQAPPATYPANYGSGQYCTLADGEQIWVPAGADPASVGCSTQSSS